MGTREFAHEPASLLQGLEGYRYKTGTMRERHGLIRGRDIHVFWGIGGDLPEMWGPPLFMA
jgi:hypothetical protein